MLDPVANFITVIASTGYDQNAVSIVVLSGGASLPTSGSFNATWWNATDYPNPSDDPNVEIVRVNGPAISGNTLPLTRAQEGTVASPKNLAGKTYKLILGITAKMIADIAANLRKPWQYVNVAGAINGSNTIFTITPVPFDPNSVTVRLARQPQEQGIDYTLSGGTITYISPPDPSLSGQPHVAQYQ
jgi:hypothetical protein